MMKCQKYHGLFQPTGASLLGRKASPVWCAVRTFSSTVSFASSLAYKMLARFFHCITVYNDHHHPYIGSTTVLSDTQWQLRL